MAHIVHVLGDGRPGGGTTVVFELCRLLARRGDQVTIVTQQHSQLVCDAAAAGLPAVEVDFSRRRRTPATAARIGRILRRVGPAVVHAHGARAGLPIALLPRRLVGRFVYTVHGFHYRHKPRVLSWLAWLAEAFCIYRADCTVFVSDADLAHAASAGLLCRSRERRVIKNAVSVDVAAAARQKAYDIGFLGRLHVQKNPFILIDILLAMRPLRPRLCVIGGGELAEAFRSRLDAAGIADQVTLCGECEHGTALHLLASCGMLVLPSRWEGHPVALIEAMHLGLPVVASDIPGNQEIVAHGETGYLVPTEDVAAYAECLKRLLGDERLRARIGAAARRRASHEHSVSRMLGAHLQIYASLTSKGYRLCPETRP